MSLHGGRSRPRWSPWSPPTSLLQACPPVSLVPSLSGGPAVAPRDGPFAESLGQWLCQGLSKPGGQRPGKMKQTPPLALSGGIFRPPEMGATGRVQAVSASLHPKNWRAGVLGGLRGSTATSDLPRVTKTGPSDSDADRKTEPVSQLLPRPLWASTCLRRLLAEGPVRAPSGLPGPRLQVSPRRSPLETAAAGETLGCRCRRGLGERRGCTALTPRARTINPG